MTGIVLVTKFCTLATMKRKLLLILFLWLFGLAAYPQSSDTLATAPRQVLLKNEDSLLPFQHLDSLWIQYPGEPVLSRLGARYSELHGPQQVVVEVVHDGRPSGHGQVLVLAGDSLEIDSLQLTGYRAVVYMSRYDSLQADLLTQRLFGARPFSDTLAMARYGYPVGYGLTTPGGWRLAFGRPAEVGLDSAYLYSKIDSIATYAIDTGVAPGIQVLVAKDGMVVLHKTYGFTRYDSLQPVRKDMLYDFASVTKVTGPLPALMKLYDENKFSLDATMGTYLPYFAHGNKKNLRYRNILSHNARLKSWIAYYTTAYKKNGKFKPKTMSHDSSANYPVRLTDNLYLHKDYKKKIYKMIRKSPLNEEPGYVYSGLSFYLYPEIIAKLTGEDYETYLKETFYRPLGAATLTYNPMRFYPRDRMIPTEVDTFFRMTPLQGVVHDEGAAMMRGVSGNAGLFGTTLDLAKLFQMYLWRGWYGNHQYISRNTMELFTIRHYQPEGNRRGLGFDKPVLVDNNDRYTALDASDHSFGHSGYTGTLAWADPDTGILFIFMSNRVYPTRLNRKLYELDIRPAMHQAIYDARTDNKE